MPSLQIFVPHLIIYTNINPHLILKLQYTSNLRMVSENYHKVNHNVGIKTCKDLATYLVLESISCALRFYCTCDIVESKDIYRYGNKSTYACVHMCLLICVFVCLFPFFVEMKSKCKIIL